MYPKEPADFNILYAITKVLLSKLELTFAEERVYHWHSAGDHSSQTGNDNIVAQFFLVWLMKRLSRVSAYRVSKQTDDSQ